MGNDWKKGKEKSKVGKKGWKEEEGGRKEGRRKEEREGGMKEGQQRKNEGKN